MRIHKLPGGFYNAQMGPLTTFCDNFRDLLGDKRLRDGFQAALQGVVASGTTKLAGFQLA